MSKKQLQKIASEYSQNKETRLIERVACYVRVSHEEQKLHGISLDAQRDKLTEYAEAHGLKIVEWYMDEGVSGRKLIKNRPALQRMLHDAQAGKFDRIIFIKLDRFFRSVAEYHECMKLIDPVLWTATEEKYDLTTANGRAFVNMKLTIAELEADQTGERIDLVNEYKVKTGQPLSGNQGIAYTVGRDSNTGLKNVIKNPDTEEMVTDLLNYFLLHQNKRQTMTYINKKYGTNHSYGSISNLLTDTKLCGNYRGNSMYCDPYITKDQFDKIQEILGNNVKTPSSKRVYLFSGLIHCPLCGSKLKGTSNTNGVLSYRCGIKHKEVKCTFGKSKSEKIIEKYLLNSLNDYVSSYISEASIEDATVKNDHAQDQIKQIKSEMTKLNNMYRKERISEDEYDRDYEELEIQLRELETQLNPPEERDLSIYEDLIKSDWRDLYNALTQENKRAFWRKYIKEIVIDENFNIIKPIFF